MSHEQREEPKPTAACREPESSGRAAMARRLVKVKVRPLLVAAYVLAVMRLLERLKDLRRGKPEELKKLVETLDCLVRLLPELPQVEVQDVDGTDLAVEVSPYLGKIVEEIFGATFDSGFVCPRPANEKRST